MKRISTRICIIIFTIIICATGVCAQQVLIPGGQLIGLQLCNDTVTVAAFDETLGAAARSAGLCEGDRILRIDDTPIGDVSDIRTALQRADGQIRLSVRRGDKTKEITLRPPMTDDGPRLGVYLRQGTTGLGTVTFYDPATGCFGALGHGVCTPEGGLVTLEKGNVYNALLLSVKKGKIGKPGQLMGTLTGSDPVGSLEKNTVSGVYGKITFPIRGDALPTAAPEQIHTGSAVIRSTVDSAIREYSVEILKIYPNTSGRTRNLLLRVTDPALLTATGGIIQGMSGSPIIQDGKLIGAVTHVLVNDPTMGYGIFIENMLDAAS